MAASVTAYEDAAAAFLQKYRLGSKVYGDEIIAFAQNHANGLANDLLVGDKTKQMTAIRRHLNSGASSRSFAEDERYYIDVIDAKRKVFAVRKLADYVQNKATLAFSKSTKAALAPIQSSRREIDDLKLEELDEDQRKELETRTAEFTTLEVPLKKLYNEQAIERFVGRLLTNGQTREQALQLVKLLGMMTLEVKLIEMTSAE